MYTCYCRFDQIGYVLCLFFFFQAEDGIRDLVRSRGLGDVYKRQLKFCGQRLFPGALVADVVGLLEVRAGRDPDGRDSVSYTHLTLPTSDLV